MICCFQLLFLEFKSLSLLVNLCSQLIKLGLSTILESKQVIHFLLVFQSNLLKVTMVSTFQISHLLINSTTVFQKFLCEISFPNLKCFSFLLFGGSNSLIQISELLLNLSIELLSVSIDLLSVALKLIPFNFAIFIKVLHSLIMSGTYLFKSFGLVNLDCFFTLS